MYREIRALTTQLDELFARLRAALLAEDTREIGTAATTAQAMMVELLNAVKALAASEGRQDADIRFVRAALASLEGAWESAQKVALGTSASEMREYVVDIKTNADYARAYLQAAVGAEEV